MSNNRRQAQAGNWAVKIITVGFPLWAVYIAFSPYRYYQSEKFRGPPYLVERDGVDDSLAQSRTVRQHINPLGNKYWANTCSITFNNLRDRKSGKLLSDAEILKRLCIGFWGGNVFSYEQSFLRGIPRDRVHFDIEKKKDRGVIFATQRRGQMPFEMEKGDHLYSAFQVLDIRVRPPGQEKVAAPPKRKGEIGQYVNDAADADNEFSYIDFGYGSSQPGSTFAGVHRLSVTRLPPEVAEKATSWRSQKQDQWQEEDGGRVRITFESYTCSPSPGEGRLIDWMYDYHKLYAGSLFNNGVSAVVRGYGRSKGS